MKFMKEKTKYNKVPLVVAIQIMTHIYTPLLNFYKEMAKNGCYSECTMCKTYALKSFNACKEKNSDFFILNEWSYTLDKISDDVIRLTDKYFGKFGESLWLAIAKVFECCRNDMYKVEYK